MSEPGNVVQEKSGRVTAEHGKIKPTDTAAYENLVGVFGTWLVSAANTATKRGYATAS